MYFKKNKTIEYNNEKKAATFGPPLSRSDDTSSNLKTEAGSHPRENGYYFDLTA